MDFKFFIGLCNNNNSKFDFMKIQDKLNSLRPYVIGIRYVQNLQIVDAVFKDNWVITESEKVKKEIVDASQNYHMFYSEDLQVTIDELLEHVEYIIDFNVEREKKQELLKQKVKELQKIFKDNPLSKLEKLKIGFSEPELLDIDIDDDVLSSGNGIEAGNGIEVVNHTEEKKTTNVKNVNGQKVELPPKEKKIEVEEFKEPTNIVCKCGPDDICPVCEEEKIGSY